jgi:hypothetical protein
MKQSFSIETDPGNGIRIVVARPDGTKVVVTGGQSKMTRSNTERKYSTFANFLENTSPQANTRARQAK